MPTPAPATEDGPRVCWIHIPRLGIPHHTHLLPYPSHPLRRRWRRSRCCSPSEPPRPSSASSCFDGWIRAAGAAARRRPRPPQAHRLSARARGVAALLFRQGPPPASLSPRSPSPAAPPERGQRAPCWRPAPRRGAARGGRSVRALERVGTHLFTEVPKDDGPASSGGRQRYGIHLIFLIHSSRLSRFSPIRGSDRLHLLNRLNRQFRIHAPGRPPPFPLWRSIARRRRRRGAAAGNATGLVGAGQEEEEDAEGAWGASSGAALGDDDISRLVTTYHKQSCGGAWVMAARRCRHQSWGHRHAAAAV
eukprot:gene16847-biopygen4194